MLMVDCERRKRREKHNIVDLLTLTVLSKINYTLLFKVKRCWIIKKYKKLKFALCYLCCSSLALSLGRKGKKNEDQEEKKDKKKSISRIAYCVISVCLP